MRLYTDFTIAFNLYNVDVTPNAFGIYKFNYVNCDLFYTMADSGRHITTLVFDIVHVHFLINVHVQCQFHFF